MFIYEPNGCGFSSRCSLLKLRYRTCFEQDVPSHSGNYWVYILSKREKDKDDKDTEKPFFTL